MNKPLIGVNWYGWFSQEAADRLDHTGKHGCQVYDYVNEHGEPVKVTGVTFDRDGKSYVWPDKVFVGRLCEKL